MQTKHLLHKGGGRITAIYSVGHATERGVASWFYVGDVEWNDGGKSKSHEIAPWAVCFDPDKPESKREFDIVSGRLNDYLNSPLIGKWHEQKNARDGRVYSWTPKKPSNHAVVYDPAMALAPTGTGL